MSEAFIVEWEVLGADWREYAFKVHAEDIGPEMDDDAIESMFFKGLYEAFEQHVSPYGTNHTEFMKWAKQVRDQKRKEAGDE